MGGSSTSVRIVMDQASVPMDGASAGVRIVMVLRFVNIKK